MSGCSSTSRHSAGEPREPRPRNVRIFASTEAAQLPTTRFGPPAASACISSRWSIHHCATRPVSTNSSRMSCGSKALAERGDEPLSRSHRPAPCRLQQHPAFVVPPGAATPPQLLRPPPGELLDPLRGLGRTARRTVAIAVVQRDEEVAGVQAEGREGGTQGIDLRGRDPPYRCPLTSCGSGGGVLSTQRRMFRLASSASTSPVVTIRENPATSRHSRQTVPIFSMCSSPSWLRSVRPGTRGPR